MRKKGRNFKQLGDRVVVYPDNYINDLEGEKLEKFCYGFLNRGIRRIVMDFSNTEMINTVGVSILIGIMEKVRENEGVLLFSGLERTNYEICDIVGLTKHVPVFKTEKEALEGFPA